MFAFLLLLSVLIYVINGYISKLRKGDWKDTIKIKE